MLYIIQLNNGRTIYNIPKGEAKLWLMLSIEFSLCNVYEQSGGSSQVCFL